MQLRFIHVFTWDVTAFIYQLLLNTCKPEQIRAQFCNLTTFLLVGCDSCGGAEQLFSYCDGQQSYVEFILSIYFNFTQIDQFK